MIEFQPLHTPQIVGELEKWSANAPRIPQAAKERNDPNDRGVPNDGQQKMAFIISHSFSGHISDTRAFHTTRRIGYRPITREPGAPLVGRKRILSSHRSRGLLAMPPQRRNLVIPL